MALPAAVEYGTVTWPPFVSSAAGEHWGSLI
jgi:hypothetical protein